jgi:hypothetical protein
MKYIILFFTLFIGVSNYSQVAITPSYRGASEKFGKNEIEYFRKTTTVFILSNLNQKEEYEKLLKEVWSVTPFIVVNANDFKVNEYADGNYSIATLFGDISISSKGTKYIHMNFLLKTIDSEGFNKDFVKLKKDNKKYSRKLMGIFNENSSFIARFPLCVNNKFLNDINLAGTSDEKLSVIYDKMFNEVCFTNANLGMLKNYFQQISQSLSKEEYYGLYDDFSKPEIKNLKANILYIPVVYKFEYNPWKWNETLREDKEIKKLLEDYIYKYEFISDTDLEKKILNNEEIYYLRYVSMNANKYLQVVNAKTGDPVYYSYGSMTYNLKNDDFEEINKSINKSNKSK